MNELNVTFSNPNEVLDFVNKIEKYPYAMDMSRGSIVVDAKSLLGIINLGFNHVVNLRIYAEDCGDLRRDIEKYIAA